MYINETFRWELALILLALNVACGAIGQTVILDPIGDATNGSDIISVSAGYARSNLYVTATAAPGTINPGAFGFILFMDTDLSTNTTQSSLPLGTDCHLWFHSGESKTQGKVIGPSPYSFGTPVPVTVTSNRVHVEIPLSVLGTTNGRMRFGFVCGTGIGTSFILPSDYVPDAVAPRGILVDFTSPIPELRIARQSGTTIVSWDTAEDFVLEQSVSLDLSASWSVVSNVATNTGGESVYTNAQPGEIQFYRLRR